MAEFFGDLERLAADLYPYRWAITAAVVIVLAVAGWYAVRVGWHMLLWRFRKPAAIVGVPLLVLFGFVAYDLGSPLFTNVTVEEEFPFAFGATVPPGMERADVEMVMAGMAMVDDAVMEEAIPAAPSITAGSMMAAGQDVVAMGMADAMAMAGSAADASEMVQSTMGEIAGQMGQPVQVATGDFKDADAFHRGSGQAIIYSAPGGGHLLRLENLDVTNGPALHVHPLDPRGPHPRRRGQAARLRRPGAAQGQSRQPELHHTGERGRERHPQRGDLLQALLRRLQRGNAHPRGLAGRGRGESIVGRILYHGVPAPSRRSPERGE